MLLYAWVEKSTGLWRKQHAIWARRAEGISSRRAATDRARTGGGHHARVRARDGQFVIPDLLGGAKTVLLGNVIQQHSGASRDWPFGSAIATAAMLAVLLALWLHARMAKRRGEVEPP